MYLIAYYYLFYIVLFQNHYLLATHNVEALLRSVEPLSANVVTGFHAVEVTARIRDSNNGVVAESHLSSIGNATIPEVDEQGHELQVLLVEHFLLADV